MGALNIAGGCLIDTGVYVTLNGGKAEDFGSFSRLRRGLTEAGELEGQWNMFSRFSRDAQQFCLACGIALRDAGLSDPEKLSRCGIVTGDNFEHERDQLKYFKDYIEGGRELGRSSLFVHTLPTSAAADASVCLGLAGPLFYWRDEDDVLGGLYTSAEDLVAEGSADYIIAAYREDDRVLCLLLERTGQTSNNSVHDVYFGLKAALDEGKI